MGVVATKLIDKPVALIGRCRRCLWSRELKATANSDSGMRGDFGLVFILHLRILFHFLVSFKHHPRPPLYAEVGNLG